MKKLKNYMSFSLLSVIAISSCGNGAEDKDKKKTEAEKVKSKIVAALSEDVVGFNDLSKEDQEKTANGVLTFLQTPEFFKTACGQADIDCEPENLEGMSQEDQSKVISAAAKMINKRAVDEKKTLVDVTSEFVTDGHVTNTEKIAVAFPTKASSGDNKQQGGQGKSNTQTRSQESKQSENKVKIQNPGAQPAANPGVDAQPAGEGAPKNVKNEAAADLENLNIAEADTLNKAFTQAGIKEQTHLGMEVELQNRTKIVMDLSIFADLLRFIKAKHNAFALTADNVTIGQVKAALKKCDLKGNGDEKTWFKGEGNRVDKGNGVFTADFADIKNGDACPYYNGLLKTLTGDVNLGFGEGFFNNGCLLEGDDNFGDRKDAGYVALILTQLFSNP